MADDRNKTSDDRKQGGEETKKSRQESSSNEELAASKEALVSAYEKLLEAKDHFRLATEAAGMDLQQDAMDRLLQGRASVEQLGEQTREIMRDKPLSTLGIAFVAGFLLSQLLSRR
jgi:ElaB/YqjD/DUF883 family membrane-anchored ribosome-binding protein